MRKLDDDEKLILSQKMEEINALYSKIVALDATAYNYDWSEFYKAILKGIRMGNVILSTNNSASEEEK